MLCLCSYIQWNEWKEISVVSCVTPVKYESIAWATSTLFPLLLYIRKCGPSWRRPSILYVQNYIESEGCVFAENKLTRGETMMRKQNPGDQSVVFTKMDEPEKVKVVKLSPSEELASSQFRFNKPKHAVASVIPAKRRSVKWMMFDDFVQFIANALCPRNEPNGSSFKKTKTKTVYPHKT